MTDHSLAYLHPIAGAVALLLLAYSGTLGLRLRTARKDRKELAARHARLAPWGYGLVLASWLGGLVSAVWLRVDLEPFASLHFRLGTLIAALLGGSALTAWLMQRGLPSLRVWHPWLGATALLLGAAHVVTGLGLMP